MISVADIADTETIAHLVESRTISPAIVRAIAIDIMVLVKNKKTSKGESS